MADATETTMLPDIYADAIDHVEIIGPNVRLTYYSVVEGEKIISARIVMPIVNIGSLVFHFAEARNKGLAPHGANDGSH